VPSKQATIQNYDNPLTSVVSVCVFVLLVVLSIGIAFFCCRELPFADNLKSNVLQFYLFTIIIGWFAFTASEDIGEFVLFGLAVGASSLVMVGMLRMFHPGFFWAGLGLLLFFSLRTVFSRVDPRGVWNKLVVGLYTVWIVTGIVCSLGNPRLLKYAQPALQLSSLHFFLDVRYFITAFVVVIFVGKSVMDAFREGAPSISTLTGFKTPAFKQESFFTVILRPIAIVVDAVLFVVQKITNAIWQVIATVGVYLIRIGVNLARYFLDLVLNSDIWIAVLKVLLTFATIIVIENVASYIAPGISTYLPREWWPYDISLNNLRELLLFAAGFMLVLTLINGMCRLWELEDIPLPKSALAAAMLMVAWALSGVISFGITRLEFVKLRGFHSLGLYTLLFLLFIASVFLFQLCYHPISKIRHPFEPPQPSMSTWAIGSTAIFLLAVLLTYSWVHRSGRDVQVVQAEQAQLTEEQQREERKRSREQAKNILLARGKNEGKDVWQSAKLANRTKVIMRISVSTDNSWRYLILRPNEIITLSARNNEIRVVWEPNLSSRNDRKQDALTTEAFFDHQPSQEEEQKAPLNFFSISNGSVIELLSED
jgi:hypothetical protein